MDFDIALFLVVLTFVSGFIWLLDKLLWEKERKENQQKLITQKGKKITEQEQEAILTDPVIVDYARSLFPIFLIVLVLRSFVFEPFRIPSQSMMPTLWVGDFILVNKFSYGIRLPVLNTEIFDTGKPKNGDVAVFRYPEDPSINYIKRVVGIPGDHIVYRNKVLYVNGKPMKQSYLSRYKGEGSGMLMNGAIHSKEDLMGIEHDILIFPNRPELAEPVNLTVPEGNYFVLGDNRDNSRDSRFWQFVPQDHLVGKAFMIWFNWDSDHGIDGLFWNRIGTSIH